MRTLLLVLAWLLAVVPFAHPETMQEGVLYIVDYDDAASFRRFTEDAGARTRDMTPEDMGHACGRQAATPAFMYQLPFWPEETWRLACVGGPVADWNEAAFLCRILQPPGQFMPLAHDSELRRVVCFLPVPPRGSRTRLRMAGAPPELGLLARMRWILGSIP